MLKITLYFLLFFSRLAAADTFEDGVKGGGFYPASELPFAPEHLALAAKAVVRVGQCSGVILSSTGYVATNIHCIREFLLPHFEYKPEVPLRLLDRTGFYNGLEILKHFDVQENWPTHVKRELSIYDYQLHDPKIVWIGQGQFTHDEKKVTEISESEFEQIKNLAEDVVILKYELHPSYPHPACMPLVPETPKNNSHLWIAGYPGWNKRPNGRGSDGAHLVFSLGTVRASLTQDPVYNSYAADLTPSDLPLFWSREKTLWERPTILLVDGDGYGGNSGGAVIDENGRLAAITFSVVKMDFEKFNEGTLFSVKALEIRDQIKHDLGADLANQIFSCSDY